MVISPKARGSRIGILIVAASIGGAVLGLAAMLAEAHPHVLRDPGWVVGGGMLAAFGGAILGLMSSPVVAIALWPKNLPYAVPAVYGLTLIVVVVATRQHDILFAPLAAAPALFGGCVVVALVFPNVVSRHGPGHCTNCDYDLGHAPHFACPECGSPVTRAGKQPPSNKPFIRYLRPLRLIAPCLLLSIAAAYISAQWISNAKFTQAKFDQITIGMSREDVETTLGVPDERGRYGDTLVYEDGTWIGTRAIYYIYFDGDRVKGREVDWW